MTYPQVLPKMDRKIHFDERSRAFGIAEEISSQPRVKKVWGYPRFRNNQGAEGHCVGFGWANELNGQPIGFNFNNADAHQIFYGAQKIDRERHNLHFEDGATVIAGAKEVQRLGFIEGYRWAFGVEQVIDALVGHGPVVLGINWYDGMYETRPSGMVEVSGRLVGGHAITLFGYHPKMRIRGEGWFKRHEVVPWVNSWGSEYGNNGIGYLKIEDLDRLLKEQGEACVPVNRLRPKVLR